MQFFSERMCLAVGHGVHQCPEMGGMVVVDCMAKFVKNDIVLQVFRHLHQIEREADGVATGTRAPTGFGIADGQIRIGESIQMRQFCHSAREGRFGFPTHLLYIVLCQLGALFQCLLFLQKRGAKLLNGTFDKSQGCTPESGDTKTVNLRAHDNATRSRVDGHGYGSKI